MSYLSKSGQRGLAPGDVKDTILPEILPAKCPGKMTSDDDESRRTSHTSLSQVSVGSAGSGYRWGAIYRAGSDTTGSQVKSSCGATIVLRATRPRGDHPDA